MTADDTARTCPGCGERVSDGRGLSPCEACLDAEAALAAHLRSTPPATRPLPTSHATSEVIRLTAEVERLTSLLAIYGDHKFSCPQRHAYIHACVCGWKDARP